MSAWIDSNKLYQYRLVYFLHATFLQATRVTVQWGQGLLKIKRKSLHLLESKTVYCMEQGALKVKSNNTSSVKSKILGSEKLLTSGTGSSPAQWLALWPEWKPVTNCDSTHFTEDTWSLIPPQRAKTIDHILCQKIQCKFNLNKARNIFVNVQFTWKNKIIPFQRVYIVNIKLLRRRYW